MTGTALFAVGCDCVGRQRRCSECEAGAQSVHVAEDFAGTNTAVEVGCTVPLMGGGMP